MKQSQFEHLYRPGWSAFEARVAQLEGRGRKAAAAEGFSHAYRRLCQHLALARERNYAAHLVDELQALAARGHQQLYRQRAPWMTELTAFVLSGFPRQVRALRGYVLVSLIAFAGSLLLAALLVARFPELIFTVMDPAQVRELEAMYDPAQSRLGRDTDRLASTDWMMFGYYVMNNIGIAFQTFASGLALGVGSLFYLLFNGVIIGATSGHLARMGFGETFFSFVIGHGAFELTAIVLAGAAGLRLGGALLMPGRLPRSQSLRHGAQDALRLVYGVFAMLLIAALLEAFWSSRASLGASLRFTVGTALWALVLTYLCRAGRESDAAP